jgi:hypothetical protein
VLLIGKDADYAIIETLAGETIEGVEIAGYGPKIGEPVYTLGCSMGHSPAMSAGHIGDTSHGSRRTSCYIATGNSGGLLYKKESGEAIGVMVQVDLKTINARFAYSIFTEKALHYGFAHGPIRYELNAISTYVPMQEIMKDLDKRNAGFIMSGKEEFSLSPSPHWIQFWTFIVGVTICVFVIRRHV